MDATFQPSHTLVTDVLVMHSQWQGEVPPTGSTGDRESDSRLAGIFHALASVGGKTQQMNTLGSMLFTVDHFPHPDRPIDPVRHVLLKWWLEIYNAKYGLVAAIDD